MLGVDGVGTILLNIHVNIDAFTIGITNIIIGN